MSIIEISRNPKLNITNKAIAFIEKFEAAIKDKFKNEPMKVIILFDLEIFVKRTEQITEPYPDKTDANLKEKIYEWLSKNTVKKTDIVSLGADKLNTNPWKNKVDVKNLSIDLYIETFPADLVSKKCTIDVDEAERLILV